MGKHTITVPFVGKSMSDLLLWRDVRNTGILVAIATALFSYLEFSAAGPAVHLFQALAVISLACFVWGQAALVLGRPGPPVFGILKQGVSEEDIRKVAEMLRPPVNQALSVVAVVVSGKDMKLSIPVCLGAYVASLLFACVPILILIYSVFLLAFTLPKAYELKKDEVDQALKAVQAQLMEVHSKLEHNVLSKIPKAKSQ